MALPAPGGHATGGGLGWHTATSRATLATMPGPEVMGCSPQLVAKREVAKSAVFVPVPEAEALVGGWRALHDPKARTGVPAHITIVVPWLSPEEIDEQRLSELDLLLSDQPAFGYVLEKVCWFGERVLWLAPSPAETFKRLTSLLARHFNTPPWEGEFSEIVPHLTVGLAGSALGGSLADAAADLSEKLPLACRAREVDVMCGDGAHWGVVHRTLLHEEARAAQPQNQ
jgi:2'-5' RNA ligase